LKDLETYLNSARENGTNYVRHDLAAREADIPKRHALTAFSLLCDEEVLKAKVKVRCPNCASSHGGVFSRQSDVPEETRRCMCGEEFEMVFEGNWEVVYELPGDDIDFFLKPDESLKIFSEEAYDVSQKYVRDKFASLESMDDKSYRGQLFDHFIGILFLQIDGIHAITRYPHSKRGEIDVLIDLSSAPDDLFRMIGHASLVENKWQKYKSEISDYNAFESKVAEINRRHEVKVVFFISMAGYKSSFDGVLDDDTTPRIIGWTREHVERMVEAGTAEPVLREAMFP